MRGEIGRRRFVVLVGGALALGQLAVIPRRVLAQAVSELARRFGGLTPLDRFYVTSYDGTPQIDESRHTLKITGLVRAPLALTMAEIRKLAPIEETLTLECISNPPDGDAIGNARWTGVKLKPLLERAGVNAKARWAVMRGADGYETAVPVEELYREENFLAYLMDGAPLAPEHGFPLRIMIPGKYGMKQPKWLTEINLVEREFVGYWERRGWSQSAWRKVNSGFFYPRTPHSSLLRLISPVPRLRAPVDIVGWALAGPAGVRKVEVSTDGGKSFSEAELIDNRSPYVWTIWHYRFAPVAPGRYEIRVRATDGDGVVQPPEDAQTGSGRSGQPRIEIEVEKA